MTDVTRIVDLPENITMQVNDNSIRSNGIDTSYKPIDVHPNPYGHPPPSIQSIPSPSQMQNILPPNQHTLPSRDIPMDTTNIVQDPQIQPNYIPPLPASAKQTTEYMKNMDEINDRKVDEHKEKINKQNKMETLIEQGQIPLIISVLFFIFNMPIVNNYFIKNFSFLSIINADGNFNTNGLIIKSLIFGGIYYILSQSINILTEL